ncbi:anaerobic ribonucleoside-triphosphate reductase activating protein [Candidatus Parcubacteria bacterium]|nr:MAG: anaerobic ribonucleoside-triphosphate reductase activating protein [Candidatus Parcubacteria bacterium]
MMIGGLDKFSLIDYPDHLAAIVFTQGCNFRCHFCYNPMLVVPFEQDKLNDTNRDKGHPQTIAEDSLFLFLETRIRKLDAVVISGGEPTLHDDLPEFVKKIKDMGFKVKLDTNGTRPEIIRGLLERGLLDYVAMDIKANEKKYDLATGTQPNMNNIKTSIDILKSSEIPHEFRSTIVPGIHKLEDINEMGELINKADKWYLQQFQASKDLVNKNFKNVQPFSDDMMKKMLETASNYTRYCRLR